MTEIPMSKRGKLRAFAKWGALCLFSLSIISGVQGGTLKFKFDPALSIREKIFIPAKSGTVSEFRDSFLRAKPLSLDSGGPKC